ncbi:MAG: phosphomevalonate kinase, partial [Candidatus Azotimanducaceae bacterium]
GSGADIALSIADHCIIHQRDCLPQKVSLPAALNMLAIWTGEAASTTQYLNMIETWRDLNAGAYLSQMTCLHKIADATVAAVKTGDADLFLTTISQYDRQLDDLSSESGLNFYNPTHRELRKKVELLHCTYKPSGAGGGDFGIAYSTNHHELTSLADQLLADDRYCFFLTGD